MVIHGEAVLPYVLCTGLRYHFKFIMFAQVDYYAVLFRLINLVKQRDQRIIVKVI